MLGNSMEAKPMVAEPCRFFGDEGVPFVEMRWGQ